MEAGLSLPRGARLTHTLQSPWEIASQWVGPREVYPEETPELAAVLTALSTARIERADVGYKGTQLKALLVLDGGQKVVFKPKRLVSASKKKRKLPSPTLQISVDHFCHLLLLPQVRPRLRGGGRAVRRLRQTQCRSGGLSPRQVCKHCCQSVGQVYSPPLNFGLVSRPLFEMTPAGSWDSEERPWWWEDTSICGRRSSLWPQTSCWAHSSCRVSVYKLVYCLKRPRGFYCLFKHFFRTAARVWRSSQTESICRCITLPVKGYLEKAWHHTSYCAYSNRISHWKLNYNCVPLYIYIYPSHLELHWKSCIKVFGGMCWEKNNIQSTLSQFQKLQFLSYKLRVWATCLCQGVWLKLIKLN